MALARDARSTAPVAADQTRSRPVTLGPQQSRSTRPSVPISSATGQPSGTPTDPFGGLDGADRDAYVAMNNMLKQYGLESLSNAVLGFIKNGYSTDTITVLLQDTPEYKQRFAGNEARAKAGLPVLSPAEYLSVESSYRQLMSAAGLPKGFYDQPSDFTDWISKDVSPQEMSQRVTLASNLVNSTDPATLDYFKQHYSHGDLVAYTLDQGRAAPLIEQQIKAAQVGGAAQAQGVNIDQARAEALAAQGVNQGQAQQGFGFIAEEQPNANKLASIYGQAGLTTNDLMNETFGSDAAIAQKRKGLASRERATFNGSSAASKSSLSQSNAGRL